MDCFESEQNLLKCSKYISYSLKPTEPFKADYLLAPAKSKALFYVGLDIDFGHANKAADAPVAMRVTGAEIWRDEQQKHAIR